MLCWNQQGRDRLLQRRYRHCRSQRHEAVRDSISLRHSSNLADGVRWLLEQKDYVSDHHIYMWLWLWSQLHYCDWWWLIDWLIDCVAETISVITRICASGNSVIAWSGGPQSTSRGPMWSTATFSAFLHPALVFCPPAPPTRPPRNSSLCIGACPT